MREIIVTRTQKIIVGLLVLILVCTVGYFLFSMNEADKDTEQLTSESSQSEIQEVDEIPVGEQKTFEPIATTSESFVVELEAEDTENDVPYTGTVNYDGEGNYLLEGTFKNDNLRVYQLGDEFISCQNDTCFSLTTSENGVDASTYMYSEDAILEYSEYAEYVGESDCPAGTCDIWSVTKPDDIDATIYVASDGRISKAEGTSNTTSFVAVFSYQPVSIERPENVTQSPF